MKVNRREVILLVLLVAIGIGYLLYTFLYTPLLVDIAEARTELAERQQQLANYEQLVAQGSLAKLEQEQQATLAVIEEKSAPLLPNLEHNRILSFIDEIAKAQQIALYAVTYGEQMLFDTAPQQVQANNTNALAYTFGSLADSFRDDPNAQPAPVPGSGTEKTPAAVVNRLTVDIQLSDTTYAQVMGFIRMLESSDRTIYIENIAIASVTSNEGSVMQAGLTYNFMQADKLTDLDEGLSTIPTLDNVGKTDPFQG